MDDEPITIDVNDMFDEGEQSQPVEQQDTTPKESSPEETKSPEVAEQPKETEGKPSDDSQDSDQADDTAKEEQPLGKAEERKQQLNTEIRDLVSQRNAIKQEVEKLNSQVYQPESVQDLVDQGMTEQDARIAAMERRQEIADYNNRVVEAQLTLSSASERVLNDFKIFDPGTPENPNPLFQPKLAEKAARTLEKALEIDPNTNQVIGSKLDVYEDIYQPIADAYELSMVAGKIEGQKATEKMLASVDAPTSAAPSKNEEEKDPFMQGFDAV